MKSGVHSPRKTNLDHPAVNPLVSDTNKPAEDSLAWRLWLNASDIATEALNSDFIQGIRNGDLSPDKYGHYTIQDAAYCQNAVGDYQAAVERATAAGMDAVASFAQARLESYQSYTDSVLKNWHLKDTTSLTPGPAAQAYINAEHYAATELSPVYLLIAMLPCDQLWPWLANEIADGNKPGNVYDFWITENNSWHGAYRIDNFLNAYFAEHEDEYDDAIANFVMQSSMMGECNFFRGACGQELLPMPTKPS